MSSVYKIYGTSDGIPPHSALGQTSLQPSIAGVPPPHSSHPALPHLTLLVFEAVLEVVCVSLPGYIIARQGMFTAEMQKFTANLNVTLFTPCLIFTKLASQLTADKLMDLAIIPAIFIVQTLVSYICSLGVSKAFGLKQRPRNFVIAMGVFGNSNSLPISLVLSLSQTVKGLHWAKIPGDNDDEVAARGILYLLIFQQLGQLLRWSWGYNVLLAPPDKYHGTDEHINSHLENGSTSTDDEHERLLDHSADTDGEDQYASGSEQTRVDTKGAWIGSAGSSERSPGLHSGEQTPLTHQEAFSSVSFGDQSKSALLNSGPLPELLPTPANGMVKPPNRTPIFFRNDQGRDIDNDEVPEDTEGLFIRYKIRIGKLVRGTLRTICYASNSVFRVLPGTVQVGLMVIYAGFIKLSVGVWQFMNPPLWAMLAAIVVASIPDLQHFFFADGTFFKNSVTSAIRQSGGVAVPLILVVLGGNLARNTLSEEQQTKEDNGIEIKLMIAALTSRMLLPIIIMAPMLALTTKFVPISILDDPIFVIVCFLITGAPSALQLAQICQINNVYMSTMSRLLFQSYVVWILPSTLVLVMCALEVVEWAQR
ncbi:MAG: hypothetical protein Q9163_005982 [Psora crenata]